MPSSEIERVDERYYQVASPRSLAQRLLIQARAAIFQDFMNCCRPEADATILDVGVSDVLNDGANLIERHYPHAENITAAGLGPGVGFVEAYGVGRYRQIEPNVRLPFDDKAFDIATSNAVIEHVGSRTAQKALVEELKRVARQVFISAPNRFFPVEHHTAIPLAHYWRPAFRASCKMLGKSEWLLPENLILTSRRDLQGLHPDARVDYTGIRMGPFSSNIFMHFRS